jgi:hypothetical protein
MPGKAFSLQSGFMKKGKEAERRASLRVELRIFRCATESFHRRKDRSCKAYNRIIGAQLDLRHVVKKSAMEAKLAKSLLCYKEAKISNLAFFCLYERSHGLPEKRQMPIRPASRSAYFMTTECDSLLHRMRV